LGAGINAIRGVYVTVVVMVCFTVTRPSDNCAASAAAASSSSSSTGQLRVDRALRGLSVEGDELALLLLLLLDGLGGIPRRDRRMLIWVDIGGGYGVAGV
jgi:hypothetical protein